MPEFQTLDSIYEKSSGSWVEGIKFEFWWVISSFSVGWGHKIRVLVRGIGFQVVIKSQHLFDGYILSWSLRGPATQHLHNEARRAEFDGLDGWDGLDGDQKCPLKFFKLCEYLELVYIYFHTK